MTAYTTAVPAILSDPGFLFWAPLGTAEPVHAVTASKFSDTGFTGAWINLGATEAGSDFKYQSTVAPVEVAEFFDPISYRTTGRVGSFAFNLASYTAANLKKVYNGGTLTVTGATTTTLSVYTPPTPGNEVRAMLGWESLDQTVRLVCYQALSSGDVSQVYAKAPAKTVLACTFNLEVPAGGQPFSLITAGAARA